MFTRIGYSALVITVFTSIVVDVSFASCSNPVVFSELSEDNYDRTYADITEDNKRPLGFQKFTVKYGAASSENPCISIQNTASQGKAVEILFETDPEALLCFKTQVPNSEDCAQNTYVHCDLTPEDTMIYEFYESESSGGSQSDITFWLRITKGIANDDEADWCNREPEYPSSLRSLPPGITPPPTVTEKTSSALKSIHINIYSTLLVLSLSLMQFTGF